MCVYDYKIPLQIALEVVYPQTPIYSMGGGISVTQARPFKTTPAYIAEWLVVEKNNCFTGAPLFLRKQNKLPTIVIVAQLCTYSHTHMNRRKDRLGILPEGQLNMHVVVLG